MKMEITNSLPRILSGFVREGHRERMRRISKKQRKRQPTLNTSPIEMSAEDKEEG
jgi:hypothetical protein